MAVSHNFRSALNGFNREDVVHYIEYLNTKNTNLVNQLSSEKKALQDELTALRAQPDLTEQLAQLEAKNAELTAANTDALAQIDALKAQLEETKANQAARNQAEELEAYRRAERMERSAKERAEQIYRQATGTLAQATTQVDSAAERYRLAAAQINSQMEQLQDAIEYSKNALLDAATTMYAIRPEGTEE